MYNFTLYLPVGIYIAETEYIQIHPPLSTSLHLLRNSQYAKNEIVQNLQVSRVFYRRNNLFLPEYARFDPKTDQKNVKMQENEFEIHKYLKLSFLIYFIYQKHDNLL